MKGRENYYWKNANRYSSLLMNRIFYWNRIHSNRWTEPKPTCCWWWKSSHWKKWNKQAKNPTNLLDPEKKERNERDSHRQLPKPDLITESPQEGQELFKPRLGEILTQKYLQKSEWISPFPKRIDRDDRSRPMEVETVTLWQPKNTV